VFDAPAAVLTPLSTVDTIRAGYRPGVHESATRPAVRRSAPKQPDERPPAPHTQRPPER
jgi:hypothetical protein